MSKSNKLQPEQYELFRNTFKELDKDKDGRLNTNEVQEILKRFKFFAEKDDVQSVMQFAGDGNFVGQDKLFEYFKSGANVHFQFNPMKQIFKMFDTGNKGYITKQELRKVLAHLGEVPSQEDLDQMFSQTDLDKDGKISFAEFLKAMDE